MPSTRFPSKQVQLDRIADLPTRDAFQYVSKILEDMHKTLAESIQNRVFYFDDDFGGIGNGIADNSNAFITASAKIQELKACTIIFGAGKHYKHSFANDTINYFLNVHNTTGVTLLGNGCTLESTLTDTGLDRNCIIGTDFSNLYVSGFNFIGGNTPLPNNTPLSTVQGERFLTYAGLVNPCKNITVINCDIKYCVGGIMCISRTPGVVNDGVVMLGCNLTEVFYPLGIWSTDNVLARFKGHHCGRSYFPTNPGNNHDVAWESTSAYTDADCIIGMIIDGSQDDSFNTFSNMKVRVTSKGRKTGISNQSSGMVYIDYRQDAVNFGKGHIRGLDVEFNLDGVGASSKFAAPVRIVKRLSDTSADTTIRGHTLRKARIHGTAVNWGNATEGIELFNTGTWESGGNSEVIDDLLLEDITIDGASTGANHLSINAAAFSKTRQSCQLKNINLSKDLSFTNDTDRCIGLHGVKAANKSATDVKVNTFTPAWTDAAAPDPTIGDGTLTARWSRQGEYVQYDLYLLIGSTTTVGAGEYSFSIPVAAANDVIPYTGAAYLLDSGANHYAGVCRILSNASTIQAIFGAPIANLFGAATPIALANGDFMHLTIRYRAAI